MAKQVINIGTVANDGSGDPLRTAFDKANDNFTELYEDVQTLQGTKGEFDNSYRCEINVAVEVGVNVITFSSAFTDANYLLEIIDPFGIGIVLDSQSSSGFQVTASGNGDIHYKATYVK